MVFGSNLNFPFSNTSSTQNILLATTTNQIKSTDGNFKCINLTCPIGVYLSFTNPATSQAQTITVSMSIPQNISVYKNGTLLTTTSNVAYNPLNATITKSFILSSDPASQICSFNSYFFYIQIKYFPPSNITNISSDVYTFYSNISYTFTSTASYITYNNSYPIDYGLIVNTTVLTSSFQGAFSYASGSTDTAGYKAYSLTIQSNYAVKWDGSVSNSYYPTVLWNLWTGLYQICVLYVTQVFITGNDLIFKQQIPSGYFEPKTQKISWVQTDASVIVNKCC